MDRQDACQASVGLETDLTSLEWYSDSLGSFRQFTLMGGPQPLGAGQYSSRPEAIAHQNRILPYHNRVSTYLQRDMLSS